MGRRLQSIADIFVDRNGRHLSYRRLVHPKRKEFRIPVNLGAQYVPAAHAIRFFASQNEKCHANATVRAVMDIFQAVFVTGPGLGVLRLLVLQLADDVEKHLPRSASGEALKISSAHKSLPPSVTNIQRPTISQ